MFVATFVSIVHGATLPMLLIVFGNITNLFTNHSSNLCTLNLTSFSQLYCPSYVILDQSNIQDLYRYENIKKYSMYSLPAILDYAILLEQIFFNHLLNFHHKSGNKVPIQLVSLIEQVSLFIITFQLSVVLFYCSAIFKLLCGP